MEFHISDENHYEFSTIYINGCSDDWAKIGKMLKKETLIFEVVTPQSKLDKLREDRNNIPTYGKYLELLRITIDDTIPHDMFNINLTDNAFHDRFDQ
jgi:hypothetical protein